MLHRILARLSPTLELARLLSLPDRNADRMFATQIVLYMGLAIFIARDALEPLEGGSTSMSLKPFEPMPLERRAQPFDHPEMALRTEADRARKSRAARVLYGLASEGRAPPLRGGTEANARRELLGAHGAQLQGGSRRQDRRRLADGLHGAESNGGPRERMEELASPGGPISPSTRQSSSPSSFA
jgi:hypothetical protein